MCPIISYLPLAGWPGLSGGFFNRQGGSSQPPFASLNVSYGVGDAPELVAQNRRRIQDCLGLSALASARQVHGDRILCLSGLPSGREEEYDGYDALITNQPGLGIMIQQADCQAVVVYDPVHEVVANIHAGWRGSVANIVGRAVGRLVEDFGSDPRQAMAAISPSLGPCCAEFKHFRETLPPEWHRFQSKPAHFDFWAISRQQLQQAGLLPEHIHTAAICTRCHPDYFSYRREGRTGRCATVVVLR